MPWSTPRLRHDDHEIVLEAVKQPGVRTNAFAALKDDREIVLEAVKNGRRGLRLGRAEGRPRFRPRPSST